MHRCLPVLMLTAVLTLTGCLDTEPDTTLDDMPTTFECGGVQGSVLPGASGALTVSPAEERGAHCYAIPADTPITITWERAPDDFASVKFSESLAGFEDKTLGIDGDASDGASITVTIPADELPQQVIAAANDAEGLLTDPQVFSESVIIFIGE